MSHELIAENLQLREQLNTLLEQARCNQDIMRRHRGLDLEFIGAGSFRELLHAVFHSLPATSDLDVVTLSLIDPAYDIRRMLVDLSIGQGEFPQLLFVQDERELGELAGSIGKPVLDPYAEQRHGCLFPEPLATPKSVALLPLIRRQRLIGWLGLGSFEETRFTSTMATDFVEHIALVLALCLENVINNERLQHIGLTDPLTGVNNRRYVERRLLEEIGRTRRQGYALSCLFIDIDHFKQINDRAGHQAGDEVLREVAARIKAELRLSDALGRFGGEEFVVLLIDAEATDAWGVAERIRFGIADQALALSSGERLEVTVSIGVSTLLHADRTQPLETIAQQFVARADQALYQAKQSGRNRVVAVD